MAQKGTLELEFRSGGATPAPPTPEDCAGFRIETVVLGTDAPYDFRSDGALSYLALHDLALVDGELEIDGLPPMRRTALQDTLTFTPEGCAIRGWAAPAPRRNSYTALYFDSQAIRADVGERYRLTEPAPFAYARDPALQRTMERLRDAASLPESDPIYLELLSLTAAIEALGVRVAGEPGRLSDWQKRQVYDYVDAHFSRPIGLDDLAQLTGLSRSHFSRAFKATTGIGPHNFVAKKRMQKAIDLLREQPALPIEAVAAAVGYQNATVFRRAFQRFFGTPPSAVRNSRL